jgi:AbrB family looped-hinge helix DNA binding protein
MVLISARAQVEEGKTLEVEKFIGAVKLTRSGQITIPKNLRSQLSLKIGDKLLVYLREEDILLRKPS